MRRLAIYQLLARFKAWRQRRRERWAEDRANAEVRDATEALQRDIPSGGYHHGDGQNRSGF